MKKILLIFSGLLFSFSMGQTLKPMAKKVQDYHRAGKNFVKYEPFTANYSVQKQNLYKSAAEDITVLQLQKTELQKIVSEKPDALEMSFPFEGGNVTVELVKHNIFADGFRVETDKGYVDYTPGVYYQGIVKGDETSVVAFSFFDDDVVGVASQLNVGNMVLGKVKNSEDYVSYNDAKLTGTNPFVCGVDELPENQMKRTPFDPSKVDPSNLLTTNCVRIYFEVANNLYIQNGSNTTTTTNWLTAMFNNIKTLYNNDDITVAMSDIMIWTTADPYPPNGNALAQFRATRTTFDGDVAQLIKAPINTSVAYVDALCTTFKYSYCGVGLAYNNVPVYSWNIEAMTHELGHNLGSPHTHACFWNGDGTAIDGCGPASGNSEGCNGPLPPPTEGGTIMSYCHLTSSGINFANGFGPQPKALIISTIEARGCLGIDCITSCALTVTNVITSNITTNSATFTIVDNTSTSWRYRVSKFDGTIILEDTTTNKVVNIDGLSEGTYYKIQVGTTDCSNPNSFQVQTMILTDADWCSGIPFMDTGGETGNYENNQSITKTFRPANSSQKLKMTFTHFDVEPADPTIYDYMNIHDGVNIGAPRFPGGNLVNGNTIPGPFEATNPQGAITVRFISDGGLQLSGWKASFECLTLATGEANANSGVNVYPTITKGLFTITSKDKILSYEVYDASGRLVSKMSKLDTKNQSVDLSKNLAGTYIVKITTNKETVSQKIIKE
ncbi:MAG: M12 family metallo-peptidase [Flavobacteriaceae bacterium]|jgi:hypothetical protein|nr:M12 family metallo-peptidase [Flavobacteriaceae bacterium]